MLSVVVPTLNESANVRELLDRLSAGLEAADEVIVVDDGDDDLPAVVAEVRGGYPQRIRVQRREVATGGLGGAVVDGMRMASGDLVVVCDGDLQHPPELIPTLRAHATAVDIVVASRYTSGGTADGRRPRSGGPPHWPPDRCAGWFSRCDYAGAPTR